MPLCAESVDLAFGSLTMKEKRTASQRLTVDGPNKKQIRTASNTNINTYNNMIIIFNITYLYYDHDNTNEII